MSLASGVTITDECINAFNEFRMSGGAKGAKTKFIIFKIADNKKEVVIDDTSKDPDYEVFLSKLENAKDSKGNPAPRYAVYDVEYDLGGGEGQRSKIVFISWVPTDTPTLWSMIYASTKENLKNALNIHTSIHGDDKDEISWKVLLNEASGGKAGK
ncbi:cofilin [Aspergillus aurantiobrunneus]